MFLSSVFTNLFFGSIGWHRDFTTYFTVDLYHDQLGIFDHCRFVSYWPRSGIHFTCTVQ
ncbi:hypothetical protein D3C84_1131200 [compost metagenome]